MASSLTIMLLWWLETCTSSPSGLYRWDLTPYHDAVIRSPTGHMWFFFRDSVTLRLHYHRWSRTTCDPGWCPCWSSRYGKRVTITADIMLVMLKSALQKFPRCESFYADLYLDVPLLPPPPPLTNSMWAPLGWPGSETCHLQSDL